MDAETPVGRINIDFAITMNCVEVHCPNSKFSLNPPRVFQAGYDLK